MKEQHIIENFCKRLVALDYDLFGMRKKRTMAQDEDKWITVHPGGKGMKSDGSGAKGGTPVLIDGETGEIKGGMGGKFTGKTIEEVKAEPKQAETGSGKATSLAKTKEAKPKYSDDFIKLAQFAQKFDKIEDDFEEGKISEEKFQALENLYSELVHKLSPEEQDLYDKMDIYDVQKIAKLSLQNKEEINPSQFSDAIKKAASAYWEYDKAIENYQAGTEELEKVEALEKNFSDIKNALSPDEHALWTKMSESDVKNLAALLSETSHNQKLSSEAQNLLKMWKEAQEASKEFDAVKGSGDKDKALAATVKEYQAEQKFMDELSRSKIDVQDEVTKWIKEHGNDPESIKSIAFLDTITNKQTPQEKPDVGFQDIQIDNPKLFAEKIQEGMDLTPLHYETAVLAEKWMHMYADADSEPFWKAFNKAPEETKQEFNQFKKFVEGGFKEVITPTPIPPSGYTTPLGELSPVPAGLPEKSAYLYSLNKFNFPTKENPVGNDESRPYAKTGFTQAGIPTKEELQQDGIYGPDTDSVFPQVPHLQNPHPDIVPVNIKDVRECPDYDDEKKEAEYVKWGHSNVPFAASFGSASGRAAAWAYTAKSNALNRILRYGIDHGDPAEIHDSRFWAKDAAHVIQELDKMLAVSRVQEPMVVYRGIDHLSRKEFYNAFKKDAVIEDPGFASTSLKVGRALGFAAGNWGLMKIIVPKGASAMSLKMREDGTAFSKYHPEEEILLPRNTKFKVIGFEKGKGDAEGIKIPIVEIIP